MLRSVAHMHDYKINAKDGQLGTLRDFYFDDRDWSVKYIVVDTGVWLPGKEVLVNPDRFGKPDYEEASIKVDLTKEQIKNSPHISEAEPISRRNTAALAVFYTWPSGVVGLPAEHTLALDLTKIRSEMESKGDPHLRSTQELLNYNVEARDGSIGHVDDFIVDMDSWSIRFLIVDTRNWLHWLPGGKQVLLSVLWLMEVDWKKTAIYIDLHRSAVENSPEFDPSQPVNEEYEKKLFDYYGRPVEVENN